jgi:uncharacterized membrane protein
LAFVILSFAVRAALALWIGGTVFLGALAAPAVFRGAPSRTLAGDLVGAMVGAFGKVKLACMAVVVVGAWIRFARWEAWNGWIAGRFTLIAAACLLELLAAWAIAPRIRAAREAIRAAGLDFEGAPTDPRRRAFRRLHGASMALQSLAALCALGVLFTFF